MDITHRPYEQEGDPSRHPLDPKADQPTEGFVGERPEDDDLANLLRRHARERQGELQEQDRTEPDLAS